MNGPRESMTRDTSASIDSISAQLFRGFSDEEYRHAYAEEYLNTLVAFQIRTIREQRGWTQAQLGERCDGKAQGWISKLEDPDYGRFTMTTLRALARAFDCVLDVRFRSFRDHSDDQEARYQGDLRVNKYDDDVRAARIPAKSIQVSGSTKLRMATVAFASTPSGWPTQIAHTAEQSASVTGGGHGR